MRALLKKKFVNIKFHFFSSSSRHSSANRMDHAFATYVCDNFDKVVSSGLLDSVRTVKDFKSFAYELFLDCRRTEVKQNLEALSAQDLFVIVENPCRTLSAYRRIRTCDEDLVRKYANKYFANPPLAYLYDDIILHMYYIPEHFLVATQYHGYHKSKECKRLLKLLADTSFTTQARILNGKEVRWL
jgi:hypothetical protein